MRAEAKVGKGESGHDQEGNLGRRGAQPRRYHCGWRHHDRRPRPCRRANGRQGQAHDRRRARRALLRDHPGRAQGLSPRRHRLQHARPQRLPARGLGQDHRRRDEEALPRADGRAQRQAIS